jgi:saccharopine dehydrogenase-like NADP-dependent oxidoreductase
MNTQNILILGAGKSATVMIEYLAEWTKNSAWTLNVVDMDALSLKTKLNQFPWIQGTVADVNEDNALLDLLHNSKLVISLLPPFMHPRVARLCLEANCHLLTASYLSEEMLSLHQNALDKGLLFLNELGLDPGIDHMTAMQFIDEVRQQGGIIDTFESYTGGLMAPQSENGPWKYKFTWNPRNVVLAASGGAVKFLHEGKYKYIPYHKVFRRTEVIELEGYGEFEVYGNRDSLKYLDLYNLKGIKTLYRGTMRRVGFCRAWDLFVQLGMTDDTYLMEGVESMTHRDFINSFLFYHPTDSVETKLAQVLRLDLDSEEFRKLKWLNLFETIPVGLNKPATPAQILQHILEKKWTLNPEDKDMIVMFHLLKYKLDSTQYELRAHLVVEGENTTHTAMAKTVGLPLAIATKLILNEEINLRGVQIPVHAEIYRPILDELTGFGMVMQHTLRKVD